MSDITNPERIRTESFATKLPDGKVEFNGTVGETDAEIAVTGEGRATVSNVVLPKFGVLLVVQ